MRIRTLPLRLAQLFSSFLNVLFLRGHPSETISGRCYREGILLNKSNWSMGYKIVNTIFFWETDHCKGAHDQDVEFAKTLLGL